LSTLLNILLQIDSLTNKKVVDFVSERFWDHADFWINAFIGVAAFGVGWKAWREAQNAFAAANLASQEARNAFSEARQAKDAANAAKEAALKAGKTVKKQSIILAIADTIKMCTIKTNTNFEDASAKINEITGKIRNIIGLYREDVGQSNAVLFQQMELCNSELLTSFGLLSMDDPGGIIFKQVRPFLALLIGHLNELQGILENELIINQ